jgi:hypothetical protein
MKRRNIEEILKHFGMSTDDLPKFNPSRTSPKEAQILIDNFKLKVRKEYLRLANENHPDKPNGDVEKMKLINNYYQILCSIQLRVRQPVYRRVFFYSNVSSGTTTTNSTSYANIF